VARSKRAEEAKRAMEEAEAQQESSIPEHAEGADKVKERQRVTREAGALIARPVSLGLSHSYMSPGVYPP